MTEDIVIKFEENNDFAGLSAQTREIFFKHSGSLIDLGKKLNERDEARKLLKRTTITLITPTPRP